MKNKNLILSLFVSAILFAACEKTDTGPVLTPQEKALTNKIWALESLTVPAINDPSQDSSITTPCSDSALMAFDIYGVYQIADPSKACDSTIVPYAKGNWAISSDGDSLALMGKRNFIWKIEMLNDTILKATFRDSISPDKNYLKKITFK
jgi:hypothetical protein